MAFSFNPRRFADNVGSPHPEEERLERERLEKERLEKERLDKERLDKERLEKERLEKERLQKERLEKERLEKERLEKERLQKERLEKERLDNERLETERLETVRLDKERLARDDMARPHGEDNVHASSGVGGSDDIAFNELPPTRVFSHTRTDLTALEAIEHLLQLRSVPPDRPELEIFTPSNTKCNALLAEIETLLPIIKSRESVRNLIRDHGLTDDDIRMLIAFKLNTPYPLYRWLNGHLTSNDRCDPEVLAHVGPAFTLLYRALEKLPQRTANAARAVVVRDIPALRRTFDNYKTRLSPGTRLSFWGFSSFSTDDDVVNRPHFGGQRDADAIFYVCGALSGVDMEPFEADGKPQESELLPLCPTVCRVASVTKVGHKVTVSIEMQPHAGHAYVEPLKRSPVANP